MSEESQSFNNHLKASGLNTHTHTRGHTLVSLARSERCKYALAYMVSKIINTGKIPGEEEIVSVFNVSETSYRRLRALVLNIQKHPALTSFKST